MRRTVEIAQAGRALVVASWLLGAAAGAQTRVDEVVITTGFRPEPLTQSVGSITVIDAGLIDARGAEHLESVLETAGNVTMTSGASRGRFVQVRGIGDLEQFVDPKHFPSVGVSVDGIDLGGIASAAMLFDVEQVEILRGPQGTRFGATALAGQIDIRSIAPSESFDAYVEAGLADYGSAQLGFAVGGALAENLSGRFAAERHRSDGYVDNRTLGRSNTADFDETTLRAKLAWSPSESTSLAVTAIEFSSDNGYDAFSFDNTRTTLSDEPGRDALDLSALGLVGRLHLRAGATIEARLNWLDSEVDYGYDEDWSYAGLCDAASCPFGGFSNTDRYMRARDEASFDLRWLATRRQESGREQSFVAGAYVQQRDEAFDRQYYGPFASDYSADRVALYGQVQIPLARRLGLSFGYRLERFDDNYADSLAFASATDDEFHSGEIALSIDLSDLSVVYALIARGNKPGGVNTEASSIYGLLEGRFQQFLDSRLVFAREALTSFEVGFKSSSLDGRLALRTALFRMLRDDAQLESWFLQYDPFLWVGILDTADGDNLGLELELDYAISDAWRLRASLGVLDTEIDSLRSFDLDLDDFVMRKGIEQTRAPSWQTYIGSEWTIAPDWRLSLEVEARDSSRYGYYHDGSIDRKTLVNASVTRALGATELLLWVRNLTDEEYAVHGLYFGNDPRKGYVPERYLQLGEPRLLGLTVRHNF
jgi:iron complex outermembrane receptor protein